MTTLYTEIVTAANTTAISPADDHTELILNVTIPIISILLFLAVMAILVVTPTVGAPTPGPRRTSQAAGAIFELPPINSAVSAATFKRILSVAMCDKQTQTVMPM